MIHSGTSEFWVKILSIMVVWHRRQRVGLELSSYPIANQGETPRLVTLSSYSTILPYKVSLGPRPIYNCSISANTVNCTRTFGLKTTRVRKDMYENFAYQHVTKRPL